jgi:UDP-N-acetylmuramoyl-tripeptide--D-alanyl-D-alanine ligase
MHFDLSWLKRAVPDAQLLQGNLQEPLVFGIDSRTLAAHEMFVALPGAHVDGHDYVKEVVTRGCAGLVIAHEKKDLLNAISPELLKNKIVISVPDTQQALLQMAAAWRAQFSIPIIAITGTVGKTSTKELLAAIMERNGAPFLITQGTQNTALGIALTLLRLREHHAGMIVEAGISQRGEMQRIANIVRPTAALITMVGHGHLAGLGSIVEVAAEKRELFHYLKEDQIGFINGDQPLLTGVGYRHPVIKFGLKTTNQIQARKLVVNSFSLRFGLKIYKDKYDVQIPRNHVGIVNQILAATSVAYHLGVPIQTILDVVQQPPVVPGRFESRPLKTGGIIINDCYNANPESMKAALLAFEHIETTGKKIAVLGDMLELGAETAFWHRQIGRFLRKVPSLNHLILVGTHVQWVKQTAPAGLSVEMAPSWKEALSLLENHLNEQSLVLVKASRSMALDKLVQAIAFDITPPRQQNLVAQS